MAVCTSQLMRMIHVFRLRCISHWFSRTSSSLSLFGLGSRLVRCNPHSCPSLIADPIACLQVLSVKCGETLLVDSSQLRSSNGQVEQHGHKVFDDQNSLHKRKESEGLK